MVEVEKYIKRLLYDQDCVIIPGFGSVLTHYLPARFDQSSGKYLPSERKVAFNEVLKIDDGLLSKFISENEGLSYVQAQRHIEDFVQIVQSLIRKNKTITLNGIGKFQLSDEGRIVFQPDQSRNFHPEFYGLRPVQTSVSEEAVAVHEESTIVTEEETKTPMVRKIAWGNWVSAASIACILVYVSAVLSNEPGATSSLNPIETIRTLFINSPEAEVTTREVPRYEEEAEVASPPVADEVVEPAVETAQKSYHIIASVYESTTSLEKYGTQMAEKLQKKGYETITTIPVRDKFMLSAGSYDTWQEARKALPGLNKAAQGAWIYKQK